MEVQRGREVLEEVLRERTTDLRTVDAERFREWLEAQLPRWRRDPVFAQRERIRDLRRACPELRVLERERKRAREADAASGEGARLARVEEELHGVEQAIAGLTAAAERADPARQARMREKLAAFHARRAALEAERDARTAASPERAHLQRIDAELRRLRAESGVEAGEARLDELLQAQGRRAGRAGGGFETAAVEAVRTHLLPELGEPAPVILTGVKLGAAGTELDQVIVRAGPGAPVKVLAVVEAKHNPNDLGHGYSRRQADLAWLTGEDPALRVTHHFPTGRFDRPAVHEQHGTRYLFTPGSFDGAPLCFVTRIAPLTGLSGGATARLRHRVATSDSAPQELLAWCRTLAEPIEAPDVLALYLDRPAHILFITHKDTEAQR